VPLQSAFCYLAGASCCLVTTMVVVVVVMMMMSSSSSHMQGEARRGALHDDI